MWRSVFIGALCFLLAQPFLHAQSNYATPYTFTTFAGSAHASGSSDGTGMAARFSNPHGVAVDISGNVYVADTVNCLIRKITPGGVVSTLAGVAGQPGYADGPGSVAEFNNPTGVAIDGNGTIYVADFGNDTIREIASSANTSNVTVTTLAGTAGIPGSADGPASTALFHNPFGIAIDSNNNLYVSDSTNCTIRIITRAGVVSTLAGVPGQAGNGNGAGNAATFSLPYGVALDGNGNVFVADHGNNVVREITSSGMVSTLAGAGTSGSSDGTGTQALLNGPSGIAVDSGGNVYVSEDLNDDIRKITVAGVVTTLAGAAGTPGSSDGTGSAAKFFFPYGLAVDGNSNLYVASTDSNTIRLGTPTTRTIQTITFDQILDQTFGAAPITLIASDSSAAPVIFSVDSGPAILSGNLLILTGVGNVMVSASQGGTTTYGRVTSTQGFMVNPALLTVAVNSGGISTYGTTPTDPGIAVTSGTLYNGDSLASLGLGDDFSLTSSSIGGVYTINVTGTADVVNYTITSQSATYTINQPSTITSAPSTIFSMGKANSFTVATTGYPIGTITETGPLPTGVTFVDNGDGTATLAGSPITDTTGTYSLTINVSNGIGTTASQALSLTVTQDRFLAWENQRFTAAQLAQPSFIANTATPFNDGVPNLLKYLFDIDPSGPMTAADRAALPTVGTTTSGGITYLTLTFRQALGTGISMNVQTSPDLQTWTTVSPPDLSQQIGTDPSTGDPIQQVGVIVPANTSRQFIRLNVTSPAAPSNLVVTQGGSGELDLTWSNGAGSSDSITVQISSDGGTTWTTLATLGGSATSYAATGLASGASYSFQLIAGNGAGASSSAPSSPSQLTAPPAPPSPVGLVGTIDGSGNMNLSWTASSGSTSYKVERETISSSTWSTLATTSDATYQDVGHGSGGYRYRVSATNDSGTPSQPSGAFPAARYAVIDLGVNFQPRKITNSGYILGSTMQWQPDYSYYVQSDYRWFNGTATQLDSSTSTEIEAYGDQEGKGIFTSAADIGEDGTVVGSTTTYDYSSLPWNDYSQEAVWAPSSATPSLNGGLPELTFYPFGDPTYGTESTSSDAAVGISGSHIWSVRTVEAAASSRPLPNFPIPIDLYEDGVETGSVTTFTQGSSPIDIADNYTYSYNPYYTFVAANKDNQALLGEEISENDFWGTGYSETLSTYVFFDGSPTPLDFSPNALSNRMNLGADPNAPNGKTYVVGRSTDGTQTIWWDGTDHIFPYATYPGAINARTSTVMLGGTPTIQPAVQIIGGWDLAEMDPATGDFDSNLCLGDLVADASPWSVVGGIALNDGGAIVGTAQKTLNDDGTPATPAGYYSGTTIPYYPSHGIMLLPVQIGVVHPQTGEETPSRQASEGGYVAVRKDATTPVTQLHLHQLNGFASAQFELTWTSAKIKIWKDAARTQPVTSGSTTFPANQDTTVYLEGVTKSTAAKDVEVDETVIMGTQVSSPMPVKLTVVQSEFQVTVIAFIPYQWVDVPFSWLVPGSLITGQVAVGDNRTYDPTLTRTFRSEERFLFTPFTDLSPGLNKLLPGDADGALDGHSVHYNKDIAVPLSEISNSHGYDWADGFDPSDPDNILAQGDGIHDPPLFFNQLIGGGQFQGQRTVETKMAAYEGVLGHLAAPIAWDFIFQMDVTNPAIPKASLIGSRTAFPAFEIYVQNSSGTNLPLYQWTPPTDRTVLSLFDTEDVPTTSPVNVP